MAKRRRRMFSAAESIEVWDTSGSLGDCGLA